MPHTPNATYAHVGVYTASTCSSLLEAQDGRGHTALHCAVAANSEGTVALLLAHGANTRARAAHSGKPCDVLVLADDLPMHIAASVGNLNIVKMLLRVHVSGVPLESIGSGVQCMEARHV